MSGGSAKRKARWPAILALFAALVCLGNVGRPLAAPIPDAPWQNPNYIPFYVSNQINGNPLSSVTSADLIGAVDTAFDVWGDWLVTGVDVGAYFQGYTALTASGSGSQNVIGFEDPFPPVYGSSGTVAATVPSLISGPDGPVIVGGDIMLNSGAFEFEIFPSDFEAGVDPLPVACDGANCVDLQSIVTHEVGHFLGLFDHSGNPAATMYPFYDAELTGVDWRTLEAEDIDRIRAIYGFTPPPEYTGVSKSGVTYRLDFDQEFAAITGNATASPTSHPDFQASNTVSSDRYIGTDDFTSDDD